MFSSFYNTKFFKATLSAVFLWLAWCPISIFPFAFVAFIPLLKIELEYFEKKDTYTSTKFFGWSYLSMLFWNLLTTWWVTYASFAGAMLAFLMNSFLMSIVLLLFHIAHKRTNHAIGYSAFICFWLSFEYLHLNWDMSWPWLTLGNIFSDNYKIVQWYEYIGTQGGSLWVLTLNTLIFYGLFISKKRRKLLKLILPILILPIVISYFIYFNYKETSNPVRITMAQPNIDPYNEKFSGTMNTEQLIKCIKVSSALIDESTDFWIAPETAIALDIWEDEIDSSEELQLLQNFIRDKPKLTLILGASTAKQYSNEQTVTARHIPNSNYYYDSYNSAIQVENKTPTKIYHKSKLVPGVEIIPFPSLMKYFEKYAINLGGTTGSLGTQSERTNFTNSKNNISIAPVICYESVYSAYVSEYVRNGANIICIVTNDGWWGDTPGYVQHLSYARLRAIENRRSIARCANTGISAFINQRGDIIQSTKWWVATGISQEINANNKFTLFNYIGDIIYKIAVGITLMIVLYTLYYSRKKNFIEQI